VKQGKFTEQDLENLLKELSAYHQLLRFLNLTGMRSGQAAAITWDMIENDNVLRMPGFLTKNGEAYSLALTDESGKPSAETAFLVNMKNRLHGAPVFDMTNFQQARNSSWDGSIRKRATTVVLSRTISGVRRSQTSRLAE
jgi:integrase